jgi:hypothetical protein
MLFAITDLLYYSLINNKNNITLNYVLIKYSTSCSVVSPVYKYLIFYYT